jgi:hypothetical protein
VTGVGLLNWRSPQHFDHRGDCSCTQCGKPTPLRSHDGEPAHKVCAEDWNDHNPDAPRATHHGTDLGTARFHSDPPTKKKGREHA